MKLSANFDSHEFRCHGPECKLAEPLVSPELVENLEAWRALLNANLAPGQPEHKLTITSGCRCVAWNKREGGKASSQHLYNPHIGLSGLAADVQCSTVPLRSLYVAALQVPRFRGIGLAPPVAPESSQGHQARSGYVHVDVRYAMARVQWGYSDSGATVAIANVLPKLGIEV
jgi:hypothetical protein